ncbi:MAG TPA: hypothetical protein VJZ71_05760 [Phycisphaerae bacterium]|nr:hypothetical protein [Phycisphaerae bacterium]
MKDRFWRGVLIGAAVVVLVAAIIAAIGFLAMERCPMCGRMK